MSLTAVALIGCGELIGPPPNTYEIITDAPILGLSDFSVSDVYTLGNIFTLSVKVEGRFRSVSSAPVGVVRCDGAVVVALIRDGSEVEWLDTDPTSNCGATDVLLVPPGVPLEFTAEGGWSGFTRQEWNESYGGDYRTVLLTTKGPAVGPRFTLSYPD